MADDFRKYSIRVAEKLNTEKKCIYCDRRRHRISRFCRKHYDQNRRTGSAKPGSKLHLLNTYKVTASETAEIIRINRKNLLIAEAIGFIDRMFFRAVRCVSIPGLNHRAHQYLRNVGEHEPEAAEVLSYLSAACALYFSKHNPFTDHENYIRNLGQIIIRWKGARASNPKILQTTASRQISRYIDKRLGVTLRIIAEAWEKRELERRERQKRLKEPLHLFDGDENENNTQKKGFK